MSEPRVGRTIAGNMAWLSVTFDVDESRAEAVSDALLEAGAASVDVSDAHAGTGREHAVFDEPGAPETVSTVEFL